MNAPTQIAVTRKFPRSTLRVSTWFERDRKHVHLFSGDENTTVLEFWDDEVSEAIEDGFLNPRDWLGSMTDIAGDAGLIDFTEDAKPVGRLVSLNPA